MSIAYRTLQEIVYDKIREGILLGRYAPGQHLVADELANELGVSRMPVREALHRLEMTGLVAATPRRGWLVSELSESEILEIYQIRAALEGLAARLAGPNLTPEDIDHMRVVVNEMKKAAAAHDINAVLQTNREFHAIIWKAARSPRLAAILQDLYDSSQRYRDLSILSPGRLETIADEHRQIADALAKRDAQAEELARDHHQGTAPRVIATFHNKRDTGKASAE